MNPPPQLRVSDVTFLIVVGVAAFAASMVAFEAGRSTDIWQTNGSDIQVPLPPGKVR